MGWGEEGDRTHLRDGSQAMQVFEKVGPEGYGVQPL